MLAHVLIAAGAAAYLVVAVERFVDLSFLRGLLSLLASTGALWLLGEHWPGLLPMALCAAFVGLTAIVLTETATSRPTVIDRLGRR